MILLGMGGGPRKDWELSSPELHLLLGILHLGPWAVLGPPWPALCCSFVDDDPLGIDPGGFKTTLPEPFTSTGSAPKTHSLPNSQLHSYNSLSWLTLEMFPRALDPPQQLDGPCTVTQTPSRPVGPDFKSYVHPEKTNFLLWSVLSGKVRPINNCEGGKDVVPNCTLPGTREPAFHKWCFSFAVKARSQRSTLKRVTWGRRSVKAECHF